MRLAEQHKRLTEKNPNRRGYLNFDRENLTRNIGGETRIADIAVLNKMRYTPLATDALCPMPARAPHVTEKGYINSVSIEL